MTLNKNSPRTTLGTPDNGYGWVDEWLRQQRQQSAFDARAAGIFAQDLIQVADHWKAAGRPALRLLPRRLPMLPDGLRRQRAGGHRHRRSHAAPTGSGANVSACCTSRCRLTYYVSYGTSFNTSGDTYAYDLPGSNTPPESQPQHRTRRVAGAAGHRLNLRVSIFNITKYHERNRDSPAGTPITEYLLSGERTATGIDIDIAGRITPLWDVFVSYAWIPIAEIDDGNSDGTARSAASGSATGRR